MECHCVCHNSFGLTVEHCFPCCTHCYICGKNIVSDFEEHLKEHEDSNILKEDLNEGFLNDE